MRHNTVDISQSYPSDFLMVFGNNQESTMHCNVQSICCEIYNPSHTVIIQQENNKRCLV